ncbi:MAG: hypothetical protein KJN97_09750, partial [Deltaproteobacteria bacterium]|nr:hypothetical protein [Deltaproteobacteria bacterium]
MQSLLLTIVSGGAFLKLLTAGGFASVHPISLVLCARAPMLNPKATHTRAPISIERFIDHLQLDRRSPRLTIHRKNVKGVSLSSN